MMASGDSIAPVVIAAARSAGVRGSARRRGVEDAAETFTDMLEATPLLHRRCCERWRDASHDPPRRLGVWHHRRGIERGHRRVPDGRRDRYYWTRTVELPPPVETTSAVQEYDEPGRGSEIPSIARERSNDWVWSPTEAPATCGGIQLALAQSDRLVLVDQRYPPDAVDSLLPNGQCT